MLVHRGSSPGLPAQFVYSFDQLLRIVDFEKYDNVVLTGGVAYYFYIQKLDGWALGSFLVAVHSSRIPVGCAAG